MDTRINSLAAFLDASVSYMSLKMKVEFEEGADEKAVMQEVFKACRKIEPDCEIEF